MKVREQSDKNVEMCVQSGLSTEQEVSLLAEKVFCAGPDVLICSLSLRLTRGSEFHAHSIFMSLLLSPRLTMTCEVILC